MNYYLFRVVYYFQLWLWDSSELIAKFIKMQMLYI